MTATPATRVPTPPTENRPRDWPAISLEATRRKVQKTQPGHRGPAVPSPCTGVCKMDAQRGWCRGCYRTVEELTQWSGASDATKLAIWAQLEQRQTLV